MPTVVPSVCIWSAKNCQCQFPISDGKWPVPVCDLSIVNSVLSIIDVDLSIPQLSMSIRLSMSIPNVDLTIVDFKFY